MTNTTLSTRGLEFDLEERRQETIVHCKGKITTESAAWLENAIEYAVIPTSRGKGIVYTCRVVLDLAGVTAVDRAGFETLLRLRSAGERRGLEVMIVNADFVGEKRMRQAIVVKALSKIKRLFNTGHRMQAAYAILQARTIGNDKP